MDDYIERSKAELNVEFSRAAHHRGVTDILEILTEVLIASGAVTRDFLITAWPSESLCGPLLHRHGRKQTTK